MGDAVSQQRRAPALVRGGNVAKNGADLPPAGVYEVVQIQQSLTK
jgi:hypothetical protein